MKTDFVRGAEWAEGYPGVINLKLFQTISLYFWLLIIIENSILSIDIH